MSFGGACVSSVSACLDRRKCKAVCAMIIAAGVPDGGMALASGFPHDSE